MLHECLAPTTVASFMATSLGREPVARPRAPRGAVDLFGWDTCDRVLRADPPADTFVVARAALLDVPAPRSVADARVLMASGAGFVVRRAERHDDGLAALAA